MLGLQALLACGVAEAQPLPQPSPSAPSFAGEPNAAEVPALIMKVAEDVQRKDYTLAVSGLIMLLVFALDVLYVKTLDDTRRAKLLPYLSVGVGAALQLAASLATGAAWAEAVNMAFITGTSASGMWHLLGKKTVGNLAAKESAANPSRQITCAPPPQEPLQASLPSATPPPDSLPLPRKPQIPPSV